MVEYTPQQLDEIRLQRDIARLLGESAYRDTPVEFPRQPKLAPPVAVGSPGAKREPEPARPVPEKRPRVRKDGPPAPERGKLANPPPLKCVREIGPDGLEAECRICLKRPPYCRCATHRLTSAAP